MIAERLSVKNFRNYESGVVNFSPTLNILVGKNAQGKTNLLEAIYLCAVGRGWRTKKDKDLIRWDTETCEVNLTMKKQYGTELVALTINNQNKKTIQINGVAVTKTSGLIGRVNCVFFSPDELKLIKETPQDRRRFLDIDISQIDKDYFYALSRYNKILAQRNSLLKRTKQEILQAIGIWDIELKKYGKIIIDKRKKFIEQLLPIVKNEHRFIAKEELDVKYEGGSLNFDIEKDMAMKFTTVGPHRDDIKITINGKDVRGFSSQGQQRTAALSLKLAELQVFKEKTGEMPLLLLDDVLSELDESRRTKLLERVEGVQCIITTTEYEGKGSVFKVENGCIL